MNKIRIGIIGASDIAYRRFIPSLLKNRSFEYMGVASRNLVKTKKFIDDYGANGYEGYDSLINDTNIDAVYISLPPALHYEWAMKALKAGKHILLEKPFTTQKNHSREIIEYASSRNLAVHENYMFLYHSQLKKIKEIINDGLLGKVRLYRIAFGFPKRAATDFRYNKDLGGGALLDCGGYPIKLGTFLLGEEVSISTSKLNYMSEYEVDMYGTATLENKKGEIAQIAFGMDNSYKCELEVWGSKAVLFTDRIFTSGDCFIPELVLKSDRKTVVKLTADDQFLGSVNHFHNCIICEGERKRNYERIMIQVGLLDEIKKGEK